MKKVTNGLEFSLLDGGVAVLEGFGCCELEHIVVPAMIGGFPVVGVAEKAFCRSEQLRSIFFPASVRFVDAQAFAWCRNLEKVIFDGVLELGERAFMGCDNLSSVVLGGELEIIGEKAFAYCPALEALILPDSVTSIGEAAFEGCRNLRSIDISDNVKVIENGTFYACGSLRQIKLPRRLEYIDEFSFAYCISIKEMLIPSRTVLNHDAFLGCGTLHRSHAVG